MTTLRLDTVDWSLAFLLKNGDNSLFRSPFEFEVIEDHWNDLRHFYAKIDIAVHPWAPARRFLFPKDRSSFRRASQLSPVDSIIFSAIIKEIGQAVESRRLPAGDDTVFSFRFDAHSQDSLFGPQDGWSEFWRVSKRLATTATSVVKTDISEFYNQVSHAVVREQLEECEVSAAHREAILSLLSTCSYNSRKGLPIGPHAAHLLAELSLVPFDNLFSARGYRFTRYIDDIHIFCPEDVDPHLAHFDVADLLDRELGLSLNSGKTRIFRQEEFINRAELALQESSISEKEERLLEIINEVTKGPYEFASFEKARELGEKAFTQEAIETIFEECFTAEYIDFPHLGWILRRLAQVGAPGGIEYVISHLEDFAPVIGDAAAYLDSADKTYSNWAELGGELVDRLKLPIVARSDYLKMVLVGLFSKIKKLNHLEALTQGFWEASAPVRRKIILAAGAGGSKDWLYSLRQQVGDFDPWLKRAFAYAATNLTPSKRQKCLEILRASSDGQERAMIEFIMDDQRAKRRSKSESRKKRIQKVKERPRVFVSYSHKDTDIAGKIAEALESEGIEIVIDREHMEPGEAIGAFVKRAIATTRHTVFVVSRESLLSSWVGIETLTSLSHEDVWEKRRLIACWLDDAFMDRDFVLTSVNKIDTELSEIDSLVEQYREKKIDSADLDSERSRLFLLRNNLTKIVRRLRDSLTLEIRDEKFDESIARIVARLTRE